ncbi:NAD(P)-dependent oxidoreductase [Pseudomonadota bacterium]|jgi:nucleoside-diphosphate-sugar epimerase|nr:nucleoside-diphosphate sugar epimerase [Euryarchaeota archaeon]MDC0181057.1 NAD(P)-dependent oxidoreductase [Pseudomonadota bacterium]|tara:strand:+ start:8408 stop:9448 length:1041 start_codon:yes stop_codon:yes gene_type:complete
MSKKVILLGGAGFIGHHLALSYVAKGFDVVICDSFQVNNLVTMLDSEHNVHEPKLYREILDERLSLLSKAAVKLKVTDLRSKHEIKEIFDQEEPDIVVLLAAVAHASRSDKDPDLAFDNGIIPLQNTLEAIRERAKIRFVYMSTSTIYGHFKKDIVDESDSVNPFGVYATYKFIGEKMVMCYGEKFNLDYSIIRPSALYGERCISRRVSQIFIESAIANRELIVSADEDEKLDFTYIQDLVDAIVAVSDSPKGSQETFNITFGNARPIYMLTEILKDYFPKLQITKTKRNEFLPKRGTLSNKKLIDLIGYKPQFELEIGYRKYIEWYIDFVKSKDIYLSKIPQANE